MEEAWRGGGAAFGPTALCSEVARGFPAQREPRGDWRLLCDSVASPYFSGGWGMNSVGSVGTGPRHRITIR